MSRNWFGLPVPRQATRYAMRAFSRAVSRPRQKSLGVLRETRAAGYWLSVIDGWYHEVQVGTAGQAVLTASDRRAIKPLDCSPPQCHPSSTKSSDVEVEKKPAR